MPGICEAHFQTVIEEIQLAHLLPDLADKLLRALLTQLAQLSCRFGGFFLCMIPFFLKSA